MKVAIIHYWLVRMRGGERVLERLLGLFPQADIYTHVYDPSQMSQIIRSHTVRTTFIQNLPAARTRYQHYLPLMPMALEELDLTDYDLVISSEAGPAKGVIVRPDAHHICYCHSPMRYLWDQYPDYKRSAGPLTRAVMKPVFNWLRVWDVTSASRVDRFLANSNFIAQRIHKFYRRESDVVFPPVPVGLYRPVEEVEQRYLWVGQFVPYKRPDLAVQAFNRLGLPLLMVGDGPMLKKLQAEAKSNIQFASGLNFEELRRAYARCRGLVFTAEEDFGIVAVEAQASGRPVLAFGRGGALDTVTPGLTGQYFQSQTEDCLIEALQRFEDWLPAFRPADAVEGARRFSPERFDEGVMAAVRAEFGSAWA